jgi:hypothetical protein
MLILLGSSITILDPDKGLDKYVHGPEAHRLPLLIPQSRHLKDLGFSWEMKTLCILKCASAWPFFSLTTMLKSNPSLGQNHRHDSSSAVSMHSNLLIQTTSGRFRHQYGKYGVRGFIK